MKSQQNPLISIGIPTYNSEKYLSKCLDSIEAQSYSDLEVIISDNSSSDNTLDIAREYVKKNNWTLITNNKNYGVFQNFNKIIDRASGEYLAIYHADDIYDPNIVETSVDYLNNNRNIKLVGTMASIIDDLGNQIGEYRIPEILEEYSGRPIDFEKTIKGIIASNSKKSLFTKRQLFITPSIMVRKSIYKNEGNFSLDKSFGSAADYEMWLRIALKNDVLIINSNLMKYRIHDSQGSKNEIRNNLNIPDIVVVIKHYQKYLRDKKIIECSNKFINKILFGTAIKQNQYKLFDKSTETLNKISSKKLTILKKFLLIANKMRMTVKIIKIKV